MSFIGSSTIRQLSKLFVVPMITVLCSASLARAAESGDGFRDYWSPRLSALIKKMDSATMTSAEKTAYDDMNGFMKANGKLDQLSGLSAGDKAALKTALNTSLTAIKNVNWGAKAKGTATKEQIIASIEAAASTIEAATSAFSMSDAKMTKFVKQYILVGMSGDMRERKIPYVKKNSWVDVARPDTGGFAGPNSDTRSIESDSGLAAI